MGILETLVSGTLSLVNSWEQGRALFDVQGFEGKATASYVAKSFEEIMQAKSEGKPIGAMSVDKAVNAFVDYQATTKIYEHLTGGDDPMNPVLASLLSKGAGLILSSVAGKLAGGIAKGYFEKNAPVDSADAELHRRGEYKNLGKEPDMIAKLVEMMGGGKNVESAGPPLGGSGGAYRGAPGVGA